MSFSTDVKEELTKQMPGARHCQIAELAAILIYSGCLYTKNQTFIELQSESTYVIQKAENLLKKLCGLQFETVTDGMDEHLQLSIYDRDIVSGIIDMIKFEDGMDTVPSLLIKSQCCKRAMLRGAFLSAGSMSNPEKGYHIEIVCENLPQANQIKEVLTDFELEAKIVERKKYQVAYIKESDQIVEILNVMGAHVSLMNLENLRILKDMRNSVNRRVNCEAANITKTVNAAAKQVADIEYLKKYYGLEKLSDPPVGKSGVNHRLRKLSELAEKVKLQRGHED